MHRLPLPSSCLALASLLTSNVARAALPVPGYPTAVTPEDTPANVLLTATDPDPGTVLTFALDPTRPPAHGSVVMTGATQARYTPGPDFFGHDSFGFLVSDESSTVPGIANITVNAVNDPPIARPFSTTTTEDVIKMMYADTTDVDSPPANVAGATQPAHGTVKFNGRQLFYYPEPHYDGPDSFTYTVTDGAATSSPATISLTVDNWDDDLDPEATTVSITADTSIQVDFSTGSSDPLESTSFCRLFFDSELNSGAGGIHVVANANREEADCDPLCSVREFRRVTYSMDLTSHGTAQVLSPYTSDVWLMTGDSNVTGDGFGYYISSQEQSMWTPPATRLTRLDHSWNTIDDELFSPTSPEDEAPYDYGVNDMLLNYIPGARQLILGMNYDDVADPCDETGEAPPDCNPSPGTTWTSESARPYLIVRAPDLTALPGDAQVIGPDTGDIDGILEPGGSIVLMPSGNYAIVTTPCMGQSTACGLVAYEYSFNSSTDAFDFVGETELDTSTLGFQWSQGLSLDDERFYIAYHEGDHGGGDVKLGIFGDDWTMLGSEMVTAYDHPTSSDPGDGKNGQRPYVLKVGSAVYVAYDEENYSVDSYGLKTEGKDWTCHITKFTISTP